MDKIPITEISNGLSNLGNTIYSLFSGKLSPQDAAEIEKIAMDFNSKSDLAQADINKIEAQGSPFQRSWRPFLAWSLTLIVVFHILIIPIIKIINQNIVLPEFDMTFVIGLLGVLVGARGYEKTKVLKEKVKIIESIKKVNEVRNATKEK